MPLLYLDLRRDTSEEAITASCAFIGKTVGFQGLTREFAGVDELLQALETAQVGIHRYQPALELLRSNRESSFEIDQNEVQKLDILHTDTSE